MPLGYARHYPCLDIYYISTINEAV